MIYSEKRENDDDVDDDNKTSLKKTLFLGLTPLVIAALIYICFNLCIQLSRCYSNWRLKKQLAIAQCSEQCLIVSNPSIDETDQQSYPQVV